MTDFLTRLAERALGLAAVVEPLLAPRFAPDHPEFVPQAPKENTSPSPTAPDRRTEPDPGDEAEPEQEAGPKAEQETDPEPEALEPKQTAPQAPDPSGMAAGPSWPEGDPLAPPRVEPPPRPEVRAQEPERPVQRRPEGLAPPPAVPTAVGFETTVTTPGGRIEGPRNPDRLPQYWPPGGQAEIPEVPPATSRSGTEKTKSAARPGVPLFGDAAPAEEPAPARDGIPVLVPEFRPVADESGFMTGGARDGVDAPGPSARRAPGGVYLPQAEQPTVRVSIGRVNVRAVLSERQQERPQERRPARAPRLSLEEYLRTQRGDAS